MFVQKPPIFLILIAKILSADVAYHLGMHIAWTLWLNLGFVE